jgi:hypothetical protein
VESYLEGIHEFALPLLTDFGASEEEMRADLLQEAIQFLHEWRERIVAQLEQVHFLSGGMNETIRAQPVQTLMVTS